MASLSEGKGKNYGRKGGDGGVKGTRITPFDRREARANIQDPSRSNNPADNPADVVRRFFNVKDEPGAVSSNVSKDELLKRLERQTQQKPSRSAQAAADVADINPDAARLRNQAAEVAQRSRETKPPSRYPLGDTTKGGPVTTMRLGDPGAPSKEAARTLQRMKDADPTTTARLQANLRAADTAPKPEAIKQSDVSQRAARFRQSFGTPTGADPKTGRPTYKPLDALTKLPKGRGGTAPSPEQYAKVQVGDLDVKRLIRTQGPQGTPTDRGVENFLLNRETKGALGGRNARQISPEQGKAAMERVKGFMADPKEVAKVKSQIQQEVGGKRAQLETPPSRPSRSTAASTASTSRPPAPQLTTTTLKPTTTAATGGPKPTAPVSTSTATKVRQTLKLAIPQQPPAPKPEFGTQVTTKTLPAKSTAPASSPDLSKTQRVQPKAPSTAGQNLEFTKSKSGSFTYKPQTSTPTPQPQAPTPEWTRTTRAELPEPAAPTRRRASGDAGPSSRLSSAPKPPATTSTPATPQARRQNILPDLGKGSTATRSGQSVTFKPRTATPKPKRSSSGLGTGLVWGGFSAADAYTTAKAQGQSDEYARNLALARGSGTTIGSVATTKVLQSLLGRVPGGKQVAGFVGPMVGSYVGDTIGGFAAGASKSDKEWMAKANRTVQAGVPSQNVQSKASGKGIIRDAQGRERVGYASKLTGSDGVTRTVYKHANAPASLAYTSSNPLERVGRRTADSGLPWISDFLKKRYAASDEAVRRANVSAQRSRAGNK